MRPATGIVTAAVRRVIVTTHEALDAEVESSWGSSLWMGMTIVWVSAAPRPPRHRTAMASPGRSVVDVPGRRCGEDEVTSVYVTHVALDNQFRTFVPAPGSPCPP